MGLFRLLFWIILIAAAVWLWRRVMHRPAAPGGQQQTTVNMVRCAQCGVHLPQAQALQNQDRWYCSRSHLEQDKQSGGH